MTTPQDSPRRNKQKRRRTKKLEAWREAKAAQGANATPKKKATK